MIRTHITPHSISSIVGFLNHGLKAPFYTYQ